MEINDALVTAITRELLRRLQSGEISLSESDTTKAPSDKTCPKPVYGVPPASAISFQTQGRKRVISETDIRKLCPASAGTGQVVEIGSRDIVTPLAEDYIAKMRITVNRVS
jgi:hypothetical protein